MYHFFGMHRGSSRWRRRIALAVLFGLQGAIALAPLAEPGARGRNVAHVEEQGASHRYLHDDASCVACAVQSMHSSPAKECPAVAGGCLQAPVAHEVQVATSRGAGRTTLARAPPPLG